MTPDLAILRATATEIILCLLMFIRPGTSHRELRSETMINPTEEAYFLHHGHTFQVIMNRTDVCSYSRQQHISLMDFVNSTFTEYRRLEGQNIGEVIDRIIRERMRQYKQRRHRRRRHRARLREERRRHEHTRPDNSREGSTRERRSTEMGREGCLPVSAFGLDTDVFRNDDGSTTKVECCYPRGYSTEHDGYLALCAACSATTTLSSDFIPRVIHEHVCLGDLLSSEGSGDYLGCLQYAQTWHGKCSQKTVHQTVLRRRQKSCNLHLDSEEHLKIEEWQQEVVAVRSGCECRMNQLSALRAFVDGGP